MDIAFTEDVKKRFEALVSDTCSRRLAMILLKLQPLKQRKADKSRPTMITVKTKIGFEVLEKAGRPRRAS